MDQQAIITLAVAIAALTLKPGPGMMLLISHTIHQGVKGCFAVLVGAQLVNLIFIAIVFSGFYSVNVDMVFISIFVKAMAAAYLIWMGIKGLQDLETDYEVEKLIGGNWFNSLTSSMALTASNPLVIIFYAGIFPTLLDVNQMTSFDFLTIIGVIVFVEMGVAAAYSLPLLLFRYKISQTALKKMSFLSSVIIILIGLYIGYTAIPAEDLKSVF